MRKLKLLNIPQIFLTICKSKKYLIIAFYIGYKFLLLLVLFAKNFYNYYNKINYYNKTLYFVCTKENEYGQK